MFDRVTNPIYHIINTPYKIFDHLFNLCSTKLYLSNINQKLHIKILEISSEQLLFNQYKEENRRLRKLLHAPLKQDVKKIFATVISKNIDFYTSQIIIDKGISDGIQIGQSVIDHKGILGQVIVSNKFTSRILLICDFAHAIPLQNLRSNIRFIAFGNGYNQDLRIESLKNDIDVQIGDVLVTSGIGGVFPEGYPVAIISSINTSQDSTYQEVYAHPIANFHTLRFVLILKYNNHFIRENPPDIPKSVIQVEKKRFMELMQEFK
uniref:Cell shape-determining protein MreC n=1 Tax=Glossina pallidipes TaxID=7398 RepID=A0A1A9Z0W6_GLOPL